MTLILTAAPEQPIQGMDPEARIIRPGGQPPMITPCCVQCNEPVEVFTIDPLASEFYMSIQVQCHGKTSGLRIPREEAIGALVNGKVIWVSFK